MSNQIMSKHIYYYTIEGNYCLLADERDKWRFLEAVRDICRKHRWSIYVFCLTDQGIHLLSDAENGRLISRMLRQSMMALYGYQKWTQRESTLAEAIIVRYSRVPLESVEEILQSCRKIHCIPLEKEYVIRLSDYWWSSYNTYTGTYTWSMVAQGMILQYFAEDPSEAARKFRKFHQGDTKRAKQSKPMWRNDSL